MLRYTLNRLVMMVFTLFLIATITFFLLAAVPGDVLTDRTERLPPEIRANIYARYGLDRPLGERYLKTMLAMFKGDFGTSILYEGQTVQSILKEKLPISARLGLQQMLLGITSGLGLGILATVKKDTWIDRGIVFIVVLLISIPHLVFGLILQKLFAGTLGWFPVIGWPEGKDLWLGGWKYTVLPTLTGCFSYIALYARLMKTSMLDVINQDYVVTARSKGLSEFDVVRKHVVRNSFIPIITLLPLSVAMSITGSFFIERIFAIPGIGLYYTTAVQGRDLPIVLGETVILSMIFIIVIFITDILYALIDPRIRLRGGKLR